ncbi:AAA family ATPase [Candidatus Woesearchaeota archaeon]|nr:AAA family ATPase [Candidatus Woesearchaeota archaeon]
MLNPGTDAIKKLIDNYYPNLNMLYGPAASGKTTCCYLASIECAKLGKKTIYIDTENGFNTERFAQLAGDDSTGFLKNIFLLKINSFNEQRDFFRKLPELASNKKIKLIIVDTIGKHYRRALKENHYMANNAMLKELRILKEISAKNKIILIANQVYQNIEKYNEVNMVGGNLVKEKMDCLVELQKTVYNNRYAVLRKYFDENFKLNEKIKFEITEKGIFNL